VDINEIKKPMEVPFTNNEDSENDDFLDEDAYDSDSF